MTLQGILVVEDEAIIAKDIELRLQALGYSVAGVVHSGEEAIERAEESAPSLILMDINLAGDIDGIDAAAHIRARQDVPVIFVTSYSDEKTLRKATQDGAYGYVVKPVTNTSLRCAIEATLGRHSADVSVRHQEQWLRTTLRSMGDAMIATSPEGRVVLLNPVAEQLTGWPAAEAVGRELAEVLRLIHEETGEAADSPVDVALRDRTVTFLGERVALVNRDGQRVPIEDSAAPISDEAGQLLGAVLVFRDVTERRRMEAEVRRLNVELLARATELEAVNGELEAFAHTVAHDLRSPLGAVASYASALLEHHRDDLTPEVGTFVGHLNATVAQMDQLIRDLLAYSRLSKDELELEPVELGRVVAAVLDELAGVIRKSGGRVDVESGLPVVIGQETVLRQIVTNLVSNALKFVEPGVAPHVRISWERDGHVVRLWVEDNGVGIAPHLQEKAFEVFQRLGGGGDYPGSGIGLAIVQRGAARMGGACGVISRPGEGSRFWVELLEAKE